MNCAAYPIIPRQRISFRTIYWLFFIGLASVVWASLSSYLGRNLEAREAMDTTNWHLWIDQRLTLKALLFRQGNWVLEEIIFRGMLLQLLRRYFPFWLSLLLAFVMSYYFAWLMLRTNSIYAPIVAHWAIDFSTLYIVFPLMAAAGRINPRGFSFPAWAWVVSAVVILTGLGVLHREFQRRPLHSPEADFKLAEV